MQRSARDWLGLASFDNGAPADDDGYLSQDLGEGLDDDEIPSGQFAAGSGIHIAIVRPRNFRDAATVGDYYRQEIPVIINLEDMEKADATRIIDFISGLILGLGGDLEKISRRTFLIVPADAAIITTHDGLTQEGFFNQALRSGVGAGPWAEVALQRAATLELAAYRAVHRRRARVGHGRVRAPLLDRHQTGCHQVRAHEEARDLLAAAGRVLLLHRLVDDGAESLFRVRDEQIRARVRHREVTARWDGA